jgi:hypothetical protein
MTVAAFGPAWLAVKLEQARNQRRAVVEVEKLGASVEYAEERPVDRLLRFQLGEEVLTAVSVDLGGSNVTDAHLTHVEALTDLEELLLNNTQITDVGLQHVGRLHGLEEVWLNGTEVTDAGLEYLKGLTELVMLDLGDTHVTEEGTKKLRQALPTCDIRD